MHHINGEENYAFDAAGYLHIQGILTQELNEALDSERSIV